MRKWLATVWLLGCMMIAASAWAQAPGNVPTPRDLVAQIVSTLVFSAIGIIFAIGGYKLFDAITPFNLEAEMCEKQNIAVGIVCAAMIFGICLIVAAVVGAP